MRQIIKKLILAGLGLGVACPFAVHAGDAYNNKLSYGGTTIPAGEYGAITVPGAGFEATRYSEAVVEIPAVEGDVTGSYGCIIKKTDANINVATHTVAGWYKLTYKESGEALLYAAMSTAGNNDHAGYKVTVTSDGYVKVCKTKWPLADNGNVVLSQERVPNGKWFHLALAITLSTSARTGIVSGFINGEPMAIDSGSFQANLNGSDSCVAFRMGDSVCAAGIVVDDTAVKSASIIQNYASSTAFLVPRGERFTYSAELAFEGYTGSSTVFNLPVLVKLPGNIPSFSYADAGGAASPNISFTTADGIDLPYEVDVWNTSGDSYVWVLVPQIAQGGTMTINWGRTISSVRKTTDTWSNYIGVWHMTTARGGYYTTSHTSEPDHTVNNIRLAPWRSTITNIMLPLENGVVGSCVQHQNTDKLDNGNAGATLRNTTPLTGRLSSPNTFSVSGWFYSTYTEDGVRCLMSGRVGSSYDAGFAVTMDEGSATRIIVRGNGNRYYMVGELPRPISSGWTHIAVSFDGETAALYANGEPVEMTGSILSTNLDGGFAVGNHVSDGGIVTDTGFRGMYDEVRLRNSKISADFAKAEYNTVKSPTTFLTASGYATITLPVFASISTAFAPGSNVRVIIDTSGEVVQDGATVLTAARGISVSSGQVYIPGGHVELSGDRTRLIFRLNASIPVSARWTNGVGNFDLRSSQNWVCYNAVGQVISGVIPTSDTTVFVDDKTDLRVRREDPMFWKATRISSVQLKEDCDWTGLASPIYADGTVVDLCGHNLSISGFGRREGSQLFDNTTTTKIPELTVDIADGNSTENYATDISKTMTLVKSGAGTLLQTRSILPTRCEVKAGILQIGASTAFTASTTVRVHDGARVDANGKSDTVYSLIIRNGGILTNTGAGIGPALSHLVGFIELESGATGYIDNPSELSLTAPNFTEYVVRLNGGKLVKRGVGKLTMQNTSIYGPGTVLVESGELDIGYKGFRADEDVKIEVADNSSSDTFLWIVEDCSLPTLQGTGCVAADGAELHVTKRLSGLIRVGKADGTYPFLDAAKLVMDDGSILDLSKLTGVYSQHANLAYADGSKISVDISARDFKLGDKLISWQLVPNDVTFKATGRPAKLLAKTDGLYFNGTGRGLILIGP